jgi:hypothetical protein
MAAGETRSSGPAELPAVRGHDSLILKLLQASWLEWLGLIVAVGVAVWLIFRIRAWFRDGEDPAADDHGMLMQITELRRQGGLSDEEFRSIKGRLVRRIDETTRPQDKHTTA